MQLKRAKTLATRAQSPTARREGRTVYRGVATAVGRTEKTCTAYPPSPERCTLALPTMHRISTHHLRPPTAVQAPNRSPIPGGILIGARGIACQVKSAFSRWRPIPQERWYVAPPAPLRGDRGATYASPTVPRNHVRAAQRPAARTVYEASDPRQERRWEAGKISIQRATREVAHGW